MTLPYDANLRVVVFQDEGVHIAQCLEYDIAAHGDSPEQALQAFQQAVTRNIIVAQHLNTAPLANLPEAPAEFFAMWDRLCAAGHERRFIHPHTSIVGRMQ